MPLGDPAELDQHRVGGLHHDRRHGRQEVVDHRDESHLKIGELAVGEFGPHVHRHPLGQGTNGVDGHDGRQIPGLQLPARPQDDGSGFWSHRGGASSSPHAHRPRKQREQCSTDEHGLPLLAPKGAYGCPEATPRGLGCAPHGESDPLSVGRRQGLHPLSSLSVEEVGLRGRPRPYGDGSAPPTASVFEV